MITSKLNKVLAGRFHAHETKTEVIIETTAHPLITVFVPIKRDRRKKITPEQIEGVLSTLVLELYSKSVETTYTENARLASREAYETLKAILAHPSTQKFLQ